MSRSRSIPQGLPVDAYMSSGRCVARATLWRLAGQMHSTKLDCHVYAFLKSRQPPTQEAELAVALDQGLRRLRWRRSRGTTPAGTLGRDTAKSLTGACVTRRFGAASCRLGETDASLMHRLEQDKHVLLCKATDPEYMPKSPVAVLAYLVQHRVECELSRRIRERMCGINTPSWVRYVRYDARRTCHRTLTQHPLSGVLRIPCKITRYTSSPRWQERFTTSPVRSRHPAGS